MYQGMIFDLDGVIRHWGDAHLRAAEARYRVPRDLILQATFGCQAFQEALVGRLPAEEWHAAARQLLCDWVGREVGGAVDDFIAYPGWIDSEMIEYVDRLRRHLRVGLLSNGTTQLEQHLLLHDLEGHFDAIVNTARIGIAKPKPLAYLVAAGQLGVEPSACLFTDDTASNIDGAQAAGLTAIRFTNLQNLQAELRRLGADVDDPAKA